MSLTRHLSLRAVAELLAKGGSAVLLIAVARALGRDAFGIFSIAWATGWLAAAASDLGLHLVAKREIVRDGERARASASGAVAAKLALTALAALAVAAAEPLLGGGDRAVLWCVSGAIVALSYVDLAQHMLRARGRFERDAALLVVARALFLAGGLAGLAAGGLRGTAVGLLAGALLGAVAAALAVAGELGRVDLGRDARRRARELLGASLPVGVGIVLSLLAFRVDLYMLDAMTDAATVGLYSAAYRLFEATQLLPAVAMSVLFPRLAATARGGDEATALRRSALVRLVAAGAAVAALGWLVAPRLVAVVYGAGYAAAGAPFAALLWAVPLVFANALLTQDLVARGRGGRFAALAAVALGVNVAANLVAIPRYGTVGAAWATVATEAVLFAGCAASVRGAVWTEREATWR